MFIKTPYMVKIKKGEKYFWCSCQKSNTQPFCDGSHKGLDGNFKPFLLKAEEDKKVFFCGCKKTKTVPFCDGSHKLL